MADISKIKLPSGNEYDIKDAVARQMISGSVSFNIVWTQADYSSSSAPTSAKLATIPAGAVVTYNNGASTATGTLVADGDASSTGYTPGFYLIYSKTQVGGDKFDEYVTITHAGSPVTYSWEKIGDTQIDLSNIVTDVEITSADKTTTTVIGSGATFTNTQPTITLATDSSSGTGKVQVATGISSVTQPTIALSAESSSATGRAQFIQSLTSTKAKATSVGTVVDWDDKDTKTVLTGVTVTAQPTITLATGSTGDVTIATGIGSATTKYLGASVSGTAVTTNGDDKVNALTGLGSPSTKAAIGANATFTITQPTINLTTANAGASGRVQLATGSWTSSSINTNLLKGISVSNETLTIGAATLDTTYVGGSATGANTAWNSKDSVTAVTGYANPTKDMVVGTGTTFNVTDPTITLTSYSGSATGRIQYVQSQGSANTTKLSATADDTAVGASGTASVIGSNSTFSVTDPTTTLSTGSTGDITVATGGTTKYMQATASGTAVTPTTTYIKGTASGGGAAWNSKDQKTVLTDVDVTVTKGGNQ